MQINNENVKERIQEYLLERPPVLIYYNDEAGIWQYSVAVQGTDFWLESFPTYSEAVEYCDLNKLPYESINWEK